MILQKQHDMEHVMETGMGSPESHISFLLSSFLKNKFIYLFICLFIFGCVGSSLLRAGFL